MPDLRRHFMFLRPCGCPVGLTDQRDKVQTEADAWESMYPTRGEERDARDRGIHVRLVDHATYRQEYYHLMLKPCTHKAVTGNA